MQGHPAIVLGEKNMPRGFFAQLKIIGSFDGVYIDGC